MGNMKKDCIQKERRKELGVKKKYLTPSFLCSKIHKVPVSEIVVASKREVWKRYMSRRCCTIFTASC